MHWGSGMGQGGQNFGRDRWQMRQLAQNEHLDWQITRRILAAFFPYWRQTVIVSVLLLLTSVGSIIPAWLTQVLIDVGIARARITLVIGLTILLIVVALITGLLGVLQSWLSNAVAQKVMADYRLRLFCHIQDQSLSFFASRKTGDLVSHVMNDVSAIQGVITSTLMGLVSNVLVIVSTLALMFGMNWQLSLLSMVVVPAFVLPTQRVGRMRQKLQSLIQQRLAGLTVQLSEFFGVSGAMLTLIFNRQPEQTKRFADENAELRDLQIQQTLVGRWLFMWLGMFSSIGPALLWGYGGWLVIHHRIGLGVVVAFTAFLGRLYGPLSQLAQLHVNVLSSIALFRRIFAVLDIEAEVKDGSIEMSRGELSGRVELQGVWFAYKSDQQEPQFVLRDICLTVQPGKMVALVGPSGAGKTTLLHLIPRFADPTRGRVLLDGKDVRELTRASMRSGMGLVPQDPYFFHDTIYNNLRFANPRAKLADMEEACRAAQIHDMIEGLPQGYETVVGERGHRLSGGERQRLAIARVLLQGPQVVLLDEATSALDSLVERRIQQALAALLAGRTAVVIAHRLSTVLAADMIVVMDKGRIAGTGTHHELLAASPLYLQLYQAQFAREDQKEEMERHPINDRTAQPWYPMI